MKEWKVLAHLEYEWRAFRLYRKIINWLVKMKIKLTSPVLCFLSRQLDKHDLLVSNLKHLYERRTGEIVVFYKCDEF
jgi:hypothetical protein